MNLYLNDTVKTFFFLVTDNALALDNPLSFRRNPLEKIPKLIMAINDKIRDEKLQYRISREVANIPLLSSGNTHKYKYIIREEILYLKSNDRTI